MGFEREKACRVWGYVTWVCGEKISGIDLKKGDLWIIMLSCKAPSFDLLPWMLHKQARFQPLQDLLWIRTGKYCAKYLLAATLFL